VLTAIGDVQAFRADRDAALARYQQAFALFQAVGAKLGQANVYWSRGRLQLLSGDSENGLRELQLAVNLYEQIGNLSGAANVYFFLGQVLASNGHFAQAAEMMEQAVALGERIDKQHPVTVYMRDVLNEVRQRAASAPSDTPAST